MQNENFRNYQGGYFKVILRPEQTGGSMSAIDITLPRGVEPPPHVHTQEDETFYILEGEMHFHINGQATQAKPGDMVFAPRGVPHHFSIESSTARFLNVMTPGNMLGYFLEFSEDATGELKIEHPQGPPPAAFIAHMTGTLTHKYGVIFI